MTTRLKYYIAAFVAAAALAAGTQLLLAEQRPRGPGFHLRQGDGGHDGGQVGGPMGPGPNGGPGGPGMRMRGPGPGGPMGFGPGLDLTDEQKAQIKQIHDSHADEFKAVREKVQAAHEGMRALIEADTIDEGAIRAKSAEVAAADAEMMILNAKVRKESQQVLTAEQLAKLKERREAGPGGPGGPRMRQRPKA